MMQELLTVIDQAVLAIEALKKPKAMQFIQETIAAIIECYQNKGKLLIAGNGGSLCDAMHFAEELTGQFRRPRKALAAMALSDPGHMSCVSNDLGFEHVFSRYVDAFGKQEDLFIGLTTSGNSSNLIAAFKKAKEKKLKMIAFLGKTGGTLKGMGDLEWIVEGFSTSDRIQEAHMTAIHIIIEGVEKKLFPNLYEVEQLHEKMAQLSR